MNAPDAEELSHIVELQAQALLKLDHQVDRHRQSRDGHCALGGVEFDPGHHQGHQLGLFAGT